MCVKYPSHLVFNQNHRISFPYTTHFVFAIIIGTRVLYAAHGTQQAISVDYYEKLLDVDRKIKEAQEALAKSIGGLAGLLDVVRDMYETSQMEFIL